jgi:hypothetical protein
LLAARPYFCCGRRYFPVKMAWGELSQGKFINSRREKLKEIINLYLI